MSLPSMRTIEPTQHPAGSPGGGPHTMSMNMAMTPVQGGMPFYGQHNMGVPAGYGLPSDNISRYALPHDARLLGHRGPKKVRMRQQAKTEKRTRKTNMRRKNSKLISGSTIAGD